MIHWTKNVTSPRPNVMPAPQHSKQIIEKCVNCGAETPYTRDTHIDYRNYYIEGAGQLCKKCYDEIYK